MWAFIGVAGFNYLTFWPEYALLRSVFWSSAELRKAKEPKKDESEKKDRCCSWFWSDWNPIANIITGWRAYQRQPIFLVSLSFVSLWFTMLSPHDIVFTAYLTSAGYVSWELAVFRGVGALVGVVATFAFPYVADRIGIKIASLLYIWEEAIFVSVACGIFTLLHFGDAFLSELAKESLKIVFLCAIVLSRCGLYGFEVGEIQLLQQGIPEDVRGEVSSVETSLCSVAMLVVFGAGLVLNNPSEFLYLAWGSGGFVLLGAMLYTIWHIRWEMHTEEHSHGPNDHEHNWHMSMHLVESKEDLERDGKHSHIHFHLRGTSGTNHDFEESEALISRKSKRSEGFDRV
eukprot:TRINITY_DN556_c0_g1_i2.p1 TRINITY_DN556_c0_g1~~TRINITY_DN556_c0_g1_i2.p1  ORF type:complete len:344 (-),score=61.35 TRINITY_DN556_c0_g1_i2:27-1058(-)